MELLLFKYITTQEKNEDATYDCTSDTTSSNYRLNTTEEMASCHKRNVHSLHLSLLLSFSFSLRQDFPSVTKLTAYRQTKTTSCHTGLLSVAKYRPYSAGTGLPGYSLLPNGWYSLTQTEAQTQMETMT